MLSGCFRNFMSPARPSLSSTKRTDAHVKAVRMRRFGMASSTYALGLGLLILCWHLDLFPGAALVTVAVLFLVINLGLLAAFVNGWNQRFQDPSLTALQVCLGVTMVAVILTLGPSIQFVAASFYSVLFVFGMLKLSARELAGAGVYVTASFCSATLIRQHLYGDVLDLRVELVGAALVIASSVWFAIAASYISSLRARLRESLEEIKQLATRDAVTGLSNRRQIDLDLEAAINHAKCYGTPLCVAMIDVDHFKSVNDRFGHACGDEVLRAVANCLGSSLRSGDRLGRFGGEEFLLILPLVPMAQASTLVERLRSSVEALRVLPDGELAVTASFGLSAWRGDESAASLIRRTDQALYRAKDEGRNRVVTDALFGAIGVDGDITTPRRLAPGSAGAAQGLSSEAAPPHG